MTFRILIPALVIGAFVFGFYSIILYLKSSYKRSNQQQNIEYNDLTNDSLLKQINDNLTVIKYCMIFLVVVTIFAIIFALIAYIIRLLT